MLYEERELVEVVFDAMKNELENDKCIWVIVMRLGVIFLFRFFVCFCIFGFWRSCGWRIW